MPYIDLMQKEKCHYLYTIGNKNVTAYKRVNISRFLWLDIQLEIRNLVPQLSKA